ncbi:unnamed protein product [Albugo candida]|uniref:Uncharacterized protein n=1 Tax=Albugo candida TaxID=65357 RepID=A0A024GHW1_9STRA|nr:unnamed protein product [Albugo candida]|eukprot:CCI46458.1 unnamed protein product [Albugo candida]
MRIGKLCGQYWMPLDSCRIHWSYPASEHSSCWCHYKLCVTSRRTSDWIFRSQHRINLPQNSSYAYLGAPYSVFSHLCDWWRLCDVSSNDTESHDISISEKRAEHFTILNYPPIEHYYPIQSGCKVRSCFSTSSYKL